MRAITTEAEQLTAAIYSFKNKYFGLLGDIPNAVSFWGRADNGAFSGECTAPDTDTGTNNQTCNGNGDGKTIPHVNEVFRGWQHFAASGLVQGIYTGIAGSSSNFHHLVGENSPTSKFSNAGWGLFTGDNSMGWGNVNFYSTSDNKLLLTLGAQNIDWEPNQPILTTEEAWNIDKKIDNGKPGNGKLNTQNPGFVPCATSANKDTAEYDLLYKDTACQLIFILN